MSKLDQDVHSVSIDDIINTIQHIVNKYSINAIIDESFESIIEVRIFSPDETSISASTIEVAELVGIHDLDITDQIANHLAADLEDEHERVLEEYESVDDHEAQQLSYFTQLAKQIRKDFSPNTTPRSVL